GPNFEGVITADGKWKLHVPHSYRILLQAGHDGSAGKYGQAKIELSLFDMEKDPFENTNVLQTYPDVASRLQAYAEEHRRQFYQ
ncbi:MAG: arylsulfatase, partial [Acidobacteria bacterium]|nr:arylsulfatase [Acidobacteriota bacterium]